MKSNHSYTSISGKVVLQAAKEIADTSPDHLIPWGTRRDQSRNKRFNQKLYDLFLDQHRQIRILDLGCSGGTFVKDCLDDGCLAVGLEGSDYSRRYQRAAWPTASDFLFTCDIACDFDLFIETGDRRERQRFDVITTDKNLKHEG